MKAGAKPVPVGNAVIAGIRTSVLVSDCDVASRFVQEDETVPALLVISDA